MLSAQWQKHWLARAVPEPSPGVVLLKGRSLDGDNASCALHSEFMPCTASFQRGNVVRTDSESLSVVVTTYNEERKRDILDLLSSIKRQRYPKIETIVVVEKSRALSSFIDGHASKIGLKCKVIFSEGLRGISYARNLGIKRATGDIIAIVDDDAVLSSDWAQNLVDIYHKYPEAIGVTGRALPLWIDGSNSWFPKPLYWIIGCTDWRGWNGEKKTSVVSGVNMSFKAEAFRKVRFRTELGAGASAEGKAGFPNEDNDFAMQIVMQTNRPIVFSPDVTVWHKVYGYRLRLNYIRKYAFWQGCAEARYSDMWYSKGRRKQFRSKLAKELLEDTLLSIFRGKQIGLRKAKIFILVATFFCAGYLSYKVRVHTYLSRFL